VRQQKEGESLVEQRTSSHPTKQPRRITEGGGEMIAARETAERRRQLGRAEDFLSSHEEPRGITGGGGEMIEAREIAERRRMLDRAEDFQSSYQATTRDHWRRWRDRR